MPVGPCGMHMSWCAMAKARPHVLQPYLSAIIGFVSVAVHAGLPDAAPATGTGSARLSLHVHNRLVALIDIYIYIVYIHMYVYSSFTHGDGG